MRVGDALEDACASVDAAATDDATSAAASHAETFDMSHSRREAMRLSRSYRPLTAKVA
jgi:hypothetical protein